MGILNSREFWATNAAFLNDSEELKHAHGMLLAQIEARELKNTRNRVLLDKLRRLKSAVKETVRLTKTYVVCFSKKYDDLNQWRSYSGSSNGYIIGLKASVLERELSQNRQWSLVECRYSKSQQESVINDLLDQFEEALDGVFPRFGKGQINEGLPQRVADEFAAIFVRRVAPSFKNPAFMEEQEWRIVLTEGRLAPNSLVKFRSGKSAITPYVPFKVRNWQLFYHEIINPFEKNDDPFEKVELLSTLMIRPHINDDFVVDGFKEFVESIGIPGELVTKSSLPFRSY